MEETYPDDRENIDKSTKNHKRIKLDIRTQHKSKKSSHKLKESQKRKMEDDRADPSPNLQFNQYTQEKS